MFKIPLIHTTVPRRYAFFLFFTLCLAGLAGNYFKFSIVNAHFIFGSIFAMLVLQLLGHGWGILAAAIISAYTYFAWNHPNAVITMTAEVAVVGWLIRRNRLNLTIADAVYWVFIGIPLGYFCFHVIGNFPPSNSLFLLTKQAVNGIANALAARLIFTLYAMRSKAERISFREIMINLLASFVLCTALIMLVIGGKNDLSNTDHQIRTSLIRDINRVSHILNYWMEDRKSTIAQIASMGSGLSPEENQSHLDHMAMLDYNFLRFAIIDKEAIAIAYFPLIDELGRSNIGKSFADRPYIPLLKQHLKPMLSEVMMSKFGQPGPVTIVLAPIVIDGEYAGAAGGIMNFDRIRSVLNMNADNQNIRYTLLDRNGNVIITNRDDQTTLKPFSRPNGTLDQLNENLFQWIPELPFNTSTIELWGKSFYVAEANIGNISEWKLIMEQPVAPFQKKLYASYIRQFILLFVILTLSLPLAAFLSRCVLASLEHLSHLTRDLPAKLATDHPIVWPQSIILEPHSLIRNFKEMGDLLTEKFAMIQQMNETLEARVRERTRSLPQSMVLSSKIMDSSMFTAKSEQVVCLKYTSPAINRLKSKP